MPLTTRETVIGDTPAWRATSSTVAPPRRRRGDFSGASVSAGTPAPCGEAVVGARVKADHRATAIVIPAQAGINSG
ncbi:MAG TPA: hypothetical protein VFO80_08385 [Sphingomonas sp.]|nr:hypothetical protein [Sphingomonas sp.]